MVVCLMAMAAVTSARTIDPGTEAKLLGWSSDGHFVVWTAVETSSSEPPEEAGGMAPPETDETATIAFVHDVWRGTSERFVLAYKVLTANGHKKAPLKTALAKLPDAAAFTAWKKSHSLIKKAAKAGPSGSLAVKIDQAVQDGGDPPTTSGATTKWHVGTTTKVTASTSCGAEHASELIEQDMAGMYEPDWTATSYWSSTGRHVFVELVEATVRTMRGPDGGRQQYIVLPCGVRVEVDAPAGLEAAAGPVAEAVDKAGLAVVSIGTAKAHRAATVIYADDAHTAAATKLAAKIPGGATVDKLTWKPKADLVVAIGDSAK